MSKKKSTSLSTPEGPMAFRLDAGAGRALGLIEEPDFTRTSLPVAGDLPTVAHNGWLGTLLFGVLSALISLFVVDALWDLVGRLSAKSPLLAQSALALALFAGVIVVMLISREIFAHLRLRKVATLRAEAIRIATTPERAEVLAFCHRLAGFYGSDPASATGRATLAAACDDLHDPATLLAIAERALLTQKDGIAREAIAHAAQRVSLITTLSPRAVIDLLFVFGQSFVLIRTLSTLYGGRASGFGLLKLMARVGGHLAVTGGMAMADSLLSQMVGAGLAARLSAKLGEGVVNGILTARIGLATVEVCRPMPFIACERIILSQVVKSIVFSKEVAENTAA